MNSILSANPTLRSADIIRVGDDLRVPTHTSERRGISTASLSMSLQSAPPRMGSTRIDSTAWATSVSGETAVFRAPSTSKGLAGRRKTMLRVHNSALEPMTHYNVQTGGLEALPRIHKHSLLPAAPL
eukprot:22417-Pyramimonas_sp.AAC.1